jgi:hypothetical protein
MRIGNTHVRFLGGARRRRRDLRQAPHAAAWHDRVMADEIVSHTCSHGFHPRHPERLAAYCPGALGGPPASSDSYGRLFSGPDFREQHLHDRPPTSTSGMAATSVLRRSILGGPTNEYSQAA